MDDFHLSRAQFLHFLTNCLPITSHTAFANEYLSNCTWKSNFLLVRREQLVLVFGIR